MGIIGALVREKQSMVASDLMTWVNLEKVGTWVVSCSIGVGSRFSIMLVVFIFPCSRLGRLVNCVRMLL